MQTYPLHYREGKVTLYLAMAEDGVTLGDGILSWRTATGTEARRLSDLRQVRLAIAPTARLGRIGSCEMTFRDGTILTVLSATSMGGRDETRARTFRSFLHDLHAQIAPADRSRVAFFAGRERGGPALAPWAAWTIAALLGFAVWYSFAQFGLRGIWLAAPALAVAAVIILPILRANSGTDYDPGALPNRLLP